MAEKGPGLRDVGPGEATREPTAKAALGRCFRSVDRAAAGAILEELFADVAHGCGRVCITEHDSKVSCVLISARELESLDEALSILSGTEGADAMRKQIADLVAALSGASPGLAPPLEN